MPLVSSPDASWRNWASCFRAKLTRWGALSEHRTLRLSGQREGVSALTWLLHLAASGAAAAVLLAALSGNSIALAFESATGLGLFHVAALALGLIPVLYATTFRRAGSAWLQRISSQQAGDSDRRLEWLLIAILVCIGFTLHIARIGEYGFSADECIKNKPRLR